MGGFGLPTMFGTMAHSRRGVNGPTPNRLPCRLGSVLSSFVQVLVPSSMAGPRWGRSRTLNT